MELCRICFKNTGTIDIFEDTEGISISSKIMYCCANIRIHKEDGLPVPDQVCRICEMELSRTYQFVLKCEAADKKLQLLHPEFGKLNEEDIILQEDGTFEEDVILDDIKLEDNVKLKMKFENIQTKLDYRFADESHINSTLKIQQCEDSKIENHVTFQNSAEVKIVQTNKHSKVGNKNECKQCGKQCKSESTLIIHMRGHTDERPYACQSCDKTYKDGGNLKRHIGRKHNQNRKREVICEICGKAFYSYAEVKTHKRTHTGETPYACNICPSKFAHSGTLIRHKLRHTDDKRHSCPKCKKKFHTKVDMRKHEISHTTEKNFKCVICNIHFKYSHNLRMHISQHTTVKNFICDYCGQIFKPKGCVKLHINRMHSSKSGTCNVCSKHVPNIETHMWKHTGNRPLKCDMCSSSFYDKKSLSRHINFKHKNTVIFQCIQDGCTNTFPSQPMLDYHVAKFHSSIIPFPCEF